MSANQIETERCSSSGVDVGSCTVEPIIIDGRPMIFQIVKIVKRHDDNMDLPLNLNPWADGEETDNRYGCSSSKERKGEKRQREWEVNDTKSESGQSQSSQDSEDDKDVEIVKIVETDPAKMWKTKGKVWLEDGRQEWIVDKVMAKKYINKTPYYEVKWWAWAHAYNSWEPINHLSNCMKAVRRFERKMKRGMEEMSGCPMMSQIKTEMNDKLHVGESGTCAAQQMESADVFDLSKIKQEPVDEDQYDGRKINDAGTFNKKPVVEEVFVLKPDDGNKEVWRDDSPIREGPEDKEHRKLKLAAWVPIDHRVRENWRFHEEPLEIIGSTLHYEKLYHLIRLKSTSESEGFMEGHDFNEKMNDLRDVVIVRSEIFRYLFPQLLIDYYQKKCFGFIDDVKTEKEKAKDVARYQLIQNFRKAKVEADYRRIQNDMLPPELQLTEEQLKESWNRECADKKTETKAIKNQKQRSWIYVHELDSNVEEKKVVDHYGLPYYYIHDRNGDDIFEDSDEDIDSDDELEEIKPTITMPSKVVVGPQEYNPYTKIVRAENQAFVQIV